MLTMESQHRETMAQNRIRGMLCNFFRDRECHTLVRPVEEEGFFSFLSTYRA